MFLFIIVCLCCFVHQVRPHGELTFYECATTEASSCTPSCWKEKRFVVPRSLKVVNRDLFTQFPDLVDIAGSGGQIHEIERYSFNELPNLQRIFLGGQYLKKIPYGVFNDLPVRQIYLAANYIELIETEAFSCPNLFSLFLDKNRIEHFDTSWFPEEGLPNLLSIYLHHNKIRAISRKAFYKFPNISYIDFSFNFIEYISNDIFKNTESLKLFDLSFNRLTTVSADSFVGLKYVEKLVLSFNLLKKLNLDMFIKSNIKSVCLTPNPFKCSCLVKYEQFLLKHKIESITPKNYLHGTDFSIKYQMPIKNNSNELPICLHVEGDCDEDGVYNGKLELVFHETYNLINKKCKLDSDCSKGLICKSDYCWSLVNDIYIKDDQYLYWGFLGLN